MKRAAAPKLQEETRDGGTLSWVLAASGKVLGFPFKLALGVAARVLQVIFAIFFVVLHPQVKWLVRSAVRSPFVQNYVKPVFQRFAVGVYEPYFAFLGRLSPYWATFSIALPLAILEPAKLYATILIAEHPKAGITLWLLFQGLSFVLIDRTWTAVRPQSRKIWAVARLHAWGWLMVAHGKYWIRSSSVYQSAVEWKDRLKRRLRIAMHRLSRKRPYA
jgi:hypothetical protein